MESRVKKPGVETDNKRSQLEFTASKIVNFCFFFPPNSLISILQISGHIILCLLLFCFQKMFFDCLICFFTSHQ